MRVYSETEIRRSFGDLHAHRAVGELIYSHSTNPRDIREAALGAVDFSQPKNVLDVGCGYGFFTLGLKGRVAKGTHVVGLDVHEVYQKPFLEACREVGAGGEFHLSDAAELATYPDRSFDLILSSFSLYFFPDAVGNIARVLTDDGVFLALTHSERSLKELIRHIPPTLESFGMPIPEVLSIQRLFRAFSFENGRGLLEPHFEEIDVQAFPNTLRFERHELDSLRPYLRMKQHLLLKEVSDEIPDQLAPALTRLMSALAQEVTERGALELNKDDAVFTCRRPIVRRAKPPRPASPRYCVTCGGRLEERVIEGKKRPICLECGSIAYENPLPVVAAVVVNDDREVLLVRRARQPMKGMWCLPTGFAENDEHIEEAVRRELEEETHLRGKVKRLLDATTAYNYFYGNLVMLSFEITDVRGAAAAGDDADEAAYFPVASLPPLAFPSHEQAVRKYVELYRDSWAIQDSSVYAPPDQDDTRAHVSDALVASVQKNAEEIARSWLEAVTTLPETRHYQGLPAEGLVSWVRLVLAHLGGWLRFPETSPSIASFYQALGRGRTAAGLPVGELMLSLRILRDRIIAHGRAAVDRRDLVSLYAATEFEMRIIGFFDHALFDLLKTQQQ